MIKNGCQTFVKYDDARKAFNKSRSALMRHTASGFFVFTPASAAIGHVTGNPFK